jgi:hypothetical protein
VFEDDLLVEELRDDKKDEDAGQGEKGRSPFEHEAVVKAEIGNVKGYIEQAETEESTVLTQLVELEDLFYYVKLREEGEIGVIFRADDLDELVKGGVTEDLELLADVLDPTLGATKLVNVEMGPVAEGKLLQVLLSHVNFKLFEAQFTSPC